MKEGEEIADLSRLCLAKVKGEQAKGAEERVAGQLKLGTDLLTDKVPGIKLLRNERSGLEGAITIAKRGKSSEGAGWRTSFRDTSSFS